MVVQMEGHHWVLQCCCYKWGAAGHVHQCTVMETSPLPVSWHWGMSWEGRGILCGERDPISSDFHDKPIPCFWICLPSFLFLPAILSSIWYYVSLLFLHIPKIPALVVYMTQSWRIPSQNYSLPITMVEQVSWKLSFFHLKTVNIPPLSFFENVVSKNKWCGKTTCQRKSEWHFKILLFGLRNSRHQSESCNLPHPHKREALHELQSPQPNSLFENGFYFCVAVQVWFHWPHSKMEKVWPSVNDK